MSRWLFQRSSCRVPWQTALAIRREKREIGYAATTLNSDELNSANNTSALSAIQGKTAGVNITSTTGGPGGSTRVVMRGEKSIRGNNNALIIVDGIITNNNSRLGNPLDSREQVDFGNRGNDIPPDDIESITVLKGPAAAALYGSIGANGAIMITTKKGKQRTATGPSKTEISYSTNYTWHRVLRIPEFQNTYGQGNVNDVPDDRRENFSWGLPFDGQIRPWGQEINGQQKVKPYSALEDNVRDFFKTGRTYENNLSIGGGTVTVAPAYWGQYPASGTVAQQVRHIITQKWFAMTGTQGFEAWTEWRRTGYPDFFVVSATSIIGNMFPGSFLYPNTELTRNAKFPGQKQVTTRVWWDGN